MSNERDEEGLNITPTGAELIANTDGAPLTHRVEKAEHLYHDLAEVNISELVRVIPWEVVTKIVLSTK